MPKTAAEELRAQEIATLIAELAQPWPKYVWAINYVIDDTFVSIYEQTIGNYSIEMTSEPERIVATLEEATRKIAEIIVEARHA